MLYSET